MTSMRIIPITIIGLLVLSCSTNTEQEQTLTQKKEGNLEPVKVIEPKEGVIELPEPEQNEADYAQLDSTIREDIKNLDRRFKSTPFYVNLKGKNYYITCSGKYDYRIERFDGTLKYGLTNDSLQTLLERVQPTVSRCSTISDRILFIFLILVFFPKSRLSEYLFRAYSFRPYIQINIHLRKA